MKKVILSDVTGVNPVAAMCLASLGQKWLEQWKNIETRGQVSVLCLPLSEVLTIRGKAGELFSVVSVGG